MPSERDDILKSNLYMKSDKIAYIIDADIVSLIKKLDGSANRPEKSSTTTIRMFLGYIQFQ